MVATDAEPKSEFPVHWRHPFSPSGESREPEKFTDDAPIVDLLWDDVPTDGHRTRLSRPTPQ